VDDEVTIAALTEAPHSMLDSALVPLEAVRVVRDGHDGGLD
jgi:hypothetical protein